MNSQARKNQHYINEFKNKYLTLYVKKYTYFFYKQPGYKQLALSKQQIAQQLSRLNPFSLSHNKKYRLRKS